MENPESNYIESANASTKLQWPTDNTDLKLFTFLLDSFIQNRYFILIGCFAHYGVARLFFNLQQLKSPKIKTKNDPEKFDHFNKKLKFTIIGVYWWFLASIFQFESFFWVLWLILIAKTLQNYDYLINYLDIFSCGNVGFFLYAIKSMANLAMLDVFLPTVSLIFFLALFKTIVTRLERTTFISRACFGFSFGYTIAMVLHQVQGQYWKEIGVGYLGSLLIIGFLAHLVIISYSKGPSSTSAASPPLNSKA